MAYWGTIVVLGASSALMKSMKAELEEFTPESIPADVRLTELIFLRDESGVHPSRLIARDFQCIGVKQHGYMPQGARWKPLKNASLVQLLLNEPCELKTWVVPISPLDVLNDRIRKCEVFHVGTSGARSTAFPDGVGFWSRMCLTSRKEQVIEAMLASYRDMDRAATERLARLALQQAAFEGRSLPSPADAPDAVDESVAIASVLRASARLPDDPGAAAAREALTVVGFRAEAGCSTVLSGIDGAIRELVDVRSLVAREARVAPSPGLHLHPTMTEAPSLRAASTSYDAGPTP